MVTEGSIIDVWFSCGAASAVAAKLTLEKYGKDCNVRIINNPIANEHPDNRRFLKDVEKWLGVSINIATNPLYPEANCEDVWEDRKYMSGVGGAPCTMVLKKHARAHWEENNPSDFLVMGFTAEEKGRVERFKKFERDNLIPILLEQGFTKKDCYEVLELYGIDLPEIYKLGYPNANCIGCVKSQSPVYWNHVRKMHPEVFKSRSEQSRRIGAKLVKCHPKHLPHLYYKNPDGHWIHKVTQESLTYFDPTAGKYRMKTPRIFLDELPEYVPGPPLKNLDFECGIFCEMK